VVILRYDGCTTHHMPEHGLMFRIKWNLSFFRPIKGGWQLQLYRNHVVNKWPQVSITVKSDFFICRYLGYSMNFIIIIVCYWWWGWRVGCSEDLFFSSIICYWWWVWRVGCSEDLIFSSIVWSVICQMCFIFIYFVFKNYYEIHWIT
jgi:hypothetical protein